MKKYLGQGEDEVASLVRAHHCLRDCDVVKVSTVFHRDHDIEFLVEDHVNCGGHVTIRKTIVSIKTNPNIHSHP